MIGAIFNLHIGGQINQLLPVIQILPDQISSKRYVERDGTYDLLHGVKFSANYYKAWESAL